MVACCHFCVWLWWAVSSETTFYKHGVKTNLASRPHLHSDWGKRRKLVQMWSQQLPHLLVKVHVLHLGFEQLHFIHGDGVLKAVLSSCRIISILLLCIHVEYRTGAGKNMTTRKRGRERERKRKKERKRERESKTKAKSCAHKLSCSVSQPSLIALYFSLWFSCLCLFDGHVFPQ